MSALMGQGEGIRDPWCCHLPSLKCLPAAPGAVLLMLETFSFLQPLGCFSPICASAVGWGVCVCV